MIYMEHPNKNRFYWLIMEQDLFGTWCVKRIFGGLSNKYSREIITPCQSHIEAAKLLTEIEYIRRQRGYIYGDIKNPDTFTLTPQIISEVEKQ